MSPAGPQTLKGWLFPLVCECPCDDDDDDSMVTSLLICIRRMRDNGGEWKEQNGTMVAYGCHGAALGFP